MTVPPFDQLVTDHGDVVMRVCRALVGPHDAEDAWSETFLAALRAYPGLDPDSNVRGWLVTIAHRKAIDGIRRTARRPVPAGDLPEVAARPVPTLEHDPDAEVLAALAQLPDKQRLAVTYHHIAGLPHAEVGTLLGTSEAAARRSSADGIANLRRRFDAPAAAHTGGTR